MSQQKKNGVFFYLHFNDSLQKRYVKRPNQKYTDRLFFLTYVTDLSLDI